MMARRGSRRPYRGNAYRDLLFGARIGAYALARTCKYGESSKNRAL
jgi:hypothetical protein